MSLFVILDDADGAIKYTPFNSEPTINLSSGWNRLSSNANYLNTSTATAYDGSIMTFAFSGTSIDLYASLQNWTTTTYDFLIDGTKFATFDRVANGPDTLYNQPIFSVNSLSDGNHTLEMVLPVVNTTTLPGGPDTALYLDYLIYEPTQNATLDAGYLFVDDSSNYVQYSTSGWVSNTIQNWVDINYMSNNNSLTTANKSGATATITFVGSSIVAWGAIPTSAASSTYALVLFDGNASERLSAPSSFGSPNGANNILGGMAWNQLLFQQDYTDESPHTVTLVALIAGALNLDFFTINTPTAYIPPILSVGPRPTTISAGATAATTATASGEAGRSSSSSSSTSYTPKSGTNHSAIIGGTVGGFAALFIALALILFWRWRRGRGARQLGSLGSAQGSVTDKIGTTGRSNNAGIQYEDQEVMFTTPTSPGLMTAPLLSFPNNLRQQRVPVEPPPPTTIDTPSSGISQLMLLAPVRPANFYADISAQGPNNSTTAAALTNVSNAPSYHALNTVDQVGALSNMPTGHISYSSFMPEERHQLGPSAASPPPVPPIPPVIAGGGITNTANWRASSGTTTTWPNSPPPMYTAS